MKRIITKSVYISNRVTKVKQDGSREFISLLTCINTLGRTLVPLFIY